MRPLVARKHLAFLLFLFAPLAARANPVNIDGTSLLAFCIVAFWAFVLEAGVVALFLAFRGMAPLRMFSAYFITNVLVFFFVFQPLLSRESMPVPAIELLIALIDALAIKFLAGLDPLQGGDYSRVSWPFALITSAFGNAASYFVGAIASHKPWIQE
jgi:hypothetical protein